MEQTERAGLTKQASKALQTRTTWIPRKERGWIFLAVAVSAFILLTGLWRMFHDYSGAFDTRSFKFSFMNYGSLARLVLFFVLANYMLAFILQKRMVHRRNLLKLWIAGLLRFVRRWHTPAAVIAIGLILLHVIGAFLYGIQLDFHNVSGLLALLVLLPVPVSGLFRYKRMDRKWHLRLGLAFAVLFLVHAFL